MIIRKEKTVKIGLAAYECRMNDTGFNLGQIEKAIMAAEDCPNCLSSLHVDLEPGDRESDCGGIMEPIAVWVRKGGEWAIIHRCCRCGALSSNRVAADDNPMKLMSIAMRPLCEPPFPLERIEEMTALMGGDGSLK